MRVTPLLRTACVTLLVGSAGRAGAADEFFEGDEPRAARYLAHYFADSDRVRVISNYGSAEVLLPRALGLGLTWNHERVTIPAVEAPAGSPEEVDARTAASRPINGSADAHRNFTKVRNEVTTSLERPHAGLTHYISAEADYLAQQVRARGDVDLRGVGLNAALELDYGWDRIDPAPDDDTPGHGGRKRTVHGSFVVTRPLTSTTIARVGAEAGRVSGLQHNPYRNVYAGGERLPERHPEDRERENVFVRVNQWFTTRAALGVAARWYRDDWGIHSSATTARLTQYVNRWSAVEYSYRYYTQTAADFYRREYADRGGIDGFRTGDYRLGGFHAHLFGARLELELGEVARAPQALRPLDITLGYQRYKNSNNFSADVVEAGLSLEF